VNRADGTAASGTVLISWPSFQTAAGDAVTTRWITAQLVPNLRASPAGTHSVVVLPLDDGTVRTEYFAVPATSPITIAAVLTTPGTGLRNLAATQQDVNAAVATGAFDRTVVHLWRGRRRSRARRNLLCLRRFRRRPASMTLGTRVMGIGRWRM
jgi:hypothetical protein